MVLMENKLLIDFYIDIDRDLDFRKKYGAHFTPKETVVEMCSHTISIAKLKKLDGVRILDIASGTGVFTFYMAKLLSDKYNVPFEKIVKENCFLSEKDNLFVDKSLNIFKDLGVVPNIFIGDSLFSEEVAQYKYDIIIGNPPYIRIQNLDNDYRKKLQSGFNSCSTGATDIYLAFLEKGLSLLKDKGILSYITPSSYIRTAAGRVIRGQLSNHLVKIKDFNSEKKFSCGTYTAITYLDKNNNSKKFKYESNGNTTKYDKHLFVDGLIKKSKGKDTLKGVCDIRGGIATLRDKIFIFKPDLVLDDYVYYKGFKIEKNALKRFVKLSIVKNINDIFNSEYMCIYPYKDLKVGYERYLEDDFAKKFPGAFVYLRANRSELLNRDKGINKGYNWYEFGRTQGLVNIEKCIITSNMNKNPHFFEANLKGFLFSSGLVLYNIQVPTRDLLTKLNSDAMYEYIYNNGSRYSGDWRGYNKKTLEKFEI